MVLAWKQTHTPMQQNQEPRNKSTHIQATNWQGSKNTQQGKDSLFSKWCWQNWIPTCKTKKVDPYLTPFVKINLKWIKDLNVRPETVKLLEENIKRKLLNIGLGDDFLGMTTKPQATKTKSNQWDYIKLKSSWRAKETINKMKRQPRNGKKYLQTTCMIRG